MPVVSKRNQNNGKDHHMTVVHLCWISSDYASNAMKSHQIIFAGNASNGCAVVVASQNETLIWFGGVQSASQMKVTKAKPSFAQVTMFRIAMKQFRRIDVCFLDKYILVTIDCVY